MTVASTIANTPSIPGMTLNTMSSSATPYPTSRPAEGTDTVDIRQPKTDDTGAVNPAKPYQVVKGKNIQGAKVGNHFSITWHFDKSPGDDKTTQIGTFSLGKYDLVMGKDIPKIPRQYRDYVGIKNRETGQVEFYDTTKQGDVYRMFDPKTGKTSNNDQPQFKPDDILTLNTGKRMDVDG